jgi:hypothetical protein
MDIVSGSKCRLNLAGFGESESDVAEMRFGGLGIFSS